MSILKKSSVYVAFFLSYIFILLLALSSSFIYYAQINKKITKQTESTKQLLLTELRTGVESGLKSMEELCNDFTFNVKIEKFAKGLPSVTLQEAMQELSLNQKQGELLFDYFIYIKDTEEIMTPNIKMNAETFLNIMYAVKDTEYREFADVLAEDHFKHYLPFIKINQGNGAYVRVMPLIQSFPVGTQQKPLGQVVIFINADKLFSMVEQFHLVTESDVYIYDENNVCILSSTDAPPLSDEIVLRQPAGERSDESIVFIQKSESLGWKFVVSTPKTLYYKENKDFLFLMGIITFIYLVAGVVLVSFLSEYSYKPIREIKNYIDAHTGENKTAKNEFEVIKTTLKEQITNSKELSELLDSQKPIVKRELLDKLLKGMVTDYDGLTERLHTIGVSFSTDLFLTVSMEIRDDCNFFEMDESSEEQSMILAKFIVENVGFDLFSEKFGYHYLDVGPNSCAFLINLYSEEQTGNAVDVIYEKIEELVLFLKRTYSLHIYAGISNVQQSQKNVQLAFDEARKAMEQRRLYGGIEPFLFSELENLETDYYYPTEKEYQLVRYIKTGDTKKAKQLLENIMDMNMRDKKLSAGAARGLIFEISSELKKLVDGISLTLGKEPFFVFDLDGYMQTPSLEAALKDFCNMIDLYQKECAEVQVSSKTKRLTDSIAVYIEENIYENWLDLNALSEEFDVTPQYISNIFKKYKGENVKDYISTLRLLKAKELLRDTDLPVKEIAVTIGYTGEIGVIRLFKKYEGITPGDYRNQVRGLHS